MVSWQYLSNKPSFNVSTMLLLTDGTVMCQENSTKNWWRLTPDQYGDYVKGTWSKLSSMHTARLYYASAVLSDGRVFVAGGEYSDSNGSFSQDDTKSCEIYDPAADKWTPISSPAGWNNVGDAPNCVLPDGRILLGSIMDKNTAIYDPVLNTWTTSAQKNDSSSEESWALLQDGTVLCIDCINHPMTETYLPLTDSWVSSGSTSVDLVQQSSIEVGPLVLLPNGRVFGIGATGHSAIYIPPTSVGRAGTWVSGPDFKDNQGNTLIAKDAPACLLINGNVLCTVGPNSTNDYLGPTSFFEFDGTNLNSVYAPTNASGVPYAGRMLLLPTGQVLFAADTKDIGVYTPDGVPDESWRPVISFCNTEVYDQGRDNLLTGEQLNGLSQANMYGDDASAATNYPIVRIKNLASGKIWYCRTHNHSTMGVATGTSIQSTRFILPGGIEYGPAELCVIANGISSKCVQVTVTTLHKLNLPTYESISKLIGSLADGPLWVLTRHGPVPIGPWGPEYVKEAQQAHNEIISGLSRLLALGKQIEKKQSEIRK